VRVPIQLQVDVRAGCVTESTPSYSIPIMIRVCMPIIITDINSQSQVTLVDHYCTYARHINNIIMPLAIYDGAILREILNLTAHLPRSSVYRLSRTFTD